MLDYYVRFSGWTAASPATLYIWTSVTPVATLLLFGVLLRQLTASFAAAAMIQRAGCVDVL